MNFRFNKSRIKFLTAILLLQSSFLFSQTNPTPQALPYSQDFGLTWFNPSAAVFSAMGFAAWNSSPSPCTTIAMAGTSTAVSDQSVDTAQVPKTTGDVYGYSGISGGVQNNDGELYIQTSSNATAGSCQLVLALNTTGNTNIVVTYDVDMVNPQTRIIGIVFQYRVGTAGAWTTLNTAYQHSIADRVANQIDNFIVPLPAAADNQPVVQVRWALARLAGGGAFSGIAIDNIIAGGNGAVLTPLYYRSVASGNWNNPATWQASPDNVTWAAATRYPTSIDNTITVQSPHLVTTAGINYLIIDEVVVDAGATLWNAIGTVFSINDGPTPIDLQIEGTFEDSSQKNAVWVNTATWQLGATANYVKANSTNARNWQTHYYNGIANIPATSNWYCRKAVGATSEPHISSTNQGPPNPQATYGNLYIENYGSAWNPNNCKFTGNQNFPLIKGSLYIGGNGTQNVAFDILNTNASCAKVIGDVVIKPGSSILNQGTGLEIQGNLINKGIINYIPSTSKLLFTGSNAQVVSGSGTLALYTLEVNKTAGDLTLSQPVVVNGNLSLISGIVNTSNIFPLVVNDNAITTGASNASFINGPITKLGDDAFTFPVGKNSDYQSIGMSAGPAKTVFWTEPFENGCISGCLANGYTGPNGTWTQSSTGTNSANANQWYVSGSECGNAAGSCQSVCPADASLHIGSILTAPVDSGAFYSIGGSVTTNKRVESPVINCTGKANIIISFNYIEGGSGATDNAFLMYYNGAAWSSYIDLFKTFGSCGAGATWTNLRVNLPATATNNPNVKIGFMWANDNDAYGNQPSFAVDDITLIDQSDAFIAEYIYTDPQVVYSSAVTPPLNHVSQCEYWTLTRAVGSASKQVTLAFDANSCGVTNLATLRTARNNGASWINEGNTATTGTIVAGTITSNAPVTGFGAFTLGSTTVDNPLPVELIYFDAKYTGKDVELKWTTANELNNDYFTLQRSKDGTKFEDLEKIDGAGNSNQVINYSDLDKQPYTGISYYRLKQTDFDGNFSYSQMVSIRIGNSDFHVISVTHPGDKSTIDISAFFPGNAMAQVTVMDVLGNTLIKKSVEVTNQQSVLSLPAIQLSSGMYFLRMSCNDQTVVTKFFY